MQVSDWYKWHHYEHKACFDWLNIQGSVVCLICANETDYRWDFNSLRAFDHNKFKNEILIKLNLSTILFTVSDSCRRKSILIVFWLE